MEFRVSFVTYNRGILAIPTILEMFVCTNNMCSTHIHTHALPPARPPNTMCIHEICAHINTHTYTTSAMLIRLLSWLYPSQIRYAASDNNLLNWNSFRFVLSKTTTIQTDKAPENCKMKLFSSMFTFRNGAEWARVPATSREHCLIPSSVSSPFFPVSRSPSTPP